jgi:hypothetical protein
MTVTRSSLFGFRLAAAASAASPAAASALSAKVGGPEPTGLCTEDNVPLPFGSAPLVLHGEFPGA